MSLSKSYLLSRKPYVNATQVRENILIILIIIFREEAMEQKIT